MRASDGGTARRMETKKGLPKQSFFQVVLPGFEPGQADAGGMILIAVLANITAFWRIAHCYIVMNKKEAE